ncbi:hypothetical protein BT69DRAFT_1291363 [Atractiella rhizophila]|nr:hypothetical protein BT69DRAFT_1291363 [Atractiella rhizophila]
MGRMEELRTKAGGWRRRSVPGSVGELTRHGDEPDQDAEDLLSRKDYHVSIYEYSQGSFRWLHFRLLSHLHSGWREDCPL